jgi:hypothetical protein
MRPWPRVSSVTFTEIINSGFPEVPGRPPEPRIVMFVLARAGMLAIRFNCAAKLADATTDLSDVST